jgi:hypothetical protein
MNEPILIRGRSWRLPKDKRPPIEYAYMARECTLTGAQLIEWAERRDAMKGRNGEAKPR